MFVFSRNGNRRRLIGCVSEPPRRLISPQMAQVAPCQTFSGRSRAFRVWGPAINAPRGARWSKRTLPLTTKLVCAEPAGFCSGRPSLITPTPDVVRVHVTCLCGGAARREHTCVRDQRKSSRSEKAAGAKNEARATLGKVQNTLVAGLRECFC